MKANRGQDETNQADYVAHYLEERIADRKFYARMDFKKLQVMSWSALIASFLSSIIIASPFPTEPWYIRLLPAFLAAVPGFLVAVESGIGYARRSSMNEDAYLTYEYLLFRLKSGEDTKNIFDEFIIYSKQLARDFPRGAVLPTISSPPETSPRSETESSEGRQA